MCLCSELRSASNDSYDSEALLENLKAVFNLVHNLVDAKKLQKQLPFTLSMKRQPQGETRISKIYNYNISSEYNTVELLRRSSKVWGENPSSFWLQDKSQQSHEFKDPQLAIIYACVQLDREEAHALILRRFYALVFNRLRSRSRSRQQQNATAEAIAKGVYDQLYQGSEEGTLDKLIEDIERLIDAGSRYDNLAEKLGIGSLFYLGQGVSRSTWENWLPKKGKVLENVITFLKSTQIVELGKEHEDLAAKLIAHLEDSLPKPQAECVWITKHVTTRKRKGPHQKPQAKRQQTQHRSWSPHDESYSNTTSAVRETVTPLPVPPDTTDTSNERSETVEVTRNNQSAVDRYNCTPLNVLLHAAEISAAPGFDMSTNPGRSAQQPSHDRLVIETDVIDNPQSYTKLRGQPMQPQSNQESGISWTDSSTDPLQHVILTSINPWGTATDMSEFLDPWVDATSIDDLFDIWGNPPPHAQNAMPIPTQSSNVNAYDSYATPPTPYLLEAATIAPSMQGNEYQALVPRPLQDVHMNLSV